MNDKSVVPEFIASIIDRKRQALEEERRQKEEAEKRALEESQLKGKKQFTEWVQGVVQLAPEFMRPYLDVTVAEPDFVRIAEGWDRLETMSLYFSIPGLAKIEFNPRKNEWRCESAGWNSHYENAEPFIQFNRYSYWESDLEFVLGKAHLQMTEYEEYVSQYATQKEEQSKRAEQYLQDEAEQEARAVEAGHQRQLKELQEKAEEQILFDAIKSDPIAIHLIKAFVLLRDERSAFEHRIYEMDETIYSIENRWSRKAEELRRQADEAERRAEDERSRLQSDLDDAEAKLKKAERGW